MQQYIWWYVRSPRWPKCRRRRGFVRLWLNKNNSAFVHIELRGATPSIPKGKRVEYLQTVACWLLD